MTSKTFDWQASQPPNTTEDPQRIIDGLSSQNKQLRRYLKWFSNTQDIDIVQRNPTIEIFSATLEETEDQELRILMAKFAESLRGKSDARIFLNGKLCFHVHVTTATSASSAVDAWVDEHPTLEPEQGVYHIYRWLSETSVER